MPKTTAKKAKRAGFDEIVASFVIKKGPDPRSVEAWVAKHPDRELIEAVLDEFLLRRQQGQTNLGWRWFSEHVMRARFGSTVHYTIVARWAKRREAAKRAKSSR